MADTPAAAPPPASGSLDAYETVATLGRGSFGVVSKVRRKADGRILVWKEMNYGRMREKERELVVSEVNILRELRHPCVVRYYDRIIDKPSATIYIVMEFCQGGDLGAVLKQCKKDKTALEEDFVWRVFAQTVAALKACHRHKDASGKLKPVLHRDLKPGNLFLDEEHNVKVGDFGLSKELSSESKLAFTSLGAWVQGGGAGARVTGDGWARGHAQRHAEALDGLACPQPPLPCPPSPTRRHPLLHEPRDDQPGADARGLRREVGHLGAGVPHL